MNYETYYIPTNFTDAGRVMGLFEIRNMVEAVLLTLPTLYLCFVLLPPVPDAQDHGHPDHHRANRRLWDHRDQR